MHGGTHPIAIAEVDVVAHPDLVAVVHDRGARQREQQAIEKFDLAAVVVQQRRQSASDPHVDPGTVVRSEDAVHVVPFLVGDHLEGELVVVAQEQRPLGARWDVRGLLQDVDQREPVLHLECHVHARHHREVERHVTFVAVAEVFARVLRPLVRLGQQHAVGELLIDVGAQLLQELVGLREVLAGGAFTFIQIRDGIEAQPVDPQIEPEVHDLDDGVMHSRIVEVEVRLMGVEPVPEVRTCNRVPRPVGRLEVREDDASVLIPLVGVTPHVEVTPLAAGLGPPGALEPVVLVAGVIDDDLGDHPQAAAVRLGHESLEVPHRPVLGVDVGVVTDVVAAIAQGGGVERQQPDRGGSQILDVIQVGSQATEVPDAVAVGVGERTHMHLVDDRGAVPIGFVGHADSLRHPGALRGGLPTRADPRGAPGG